MTKFYQNSHLALGHLAKLSVSQIWETEKTNPSHSQFCLLNLPEVKKISKARTTDAQWSLFSLNFRAFGLGRQIGQINSWAFGVFLAKLSAPILVSPCFPLFNHYFYKKLSLYIHIPNIYLGFGLQRIRHLAFVCP